MNEKDYPPNVVVVARFPPHVGNARMAAFRFVSARRYLTV